MSKGEEMYRPSVMEKMMPILLVLAIGMAFMVGVLWQKVNNLEKNGVTANNAGAAGAAGQQPPAPTVSMDTIKGLWDKELVKFGDNKKKVLFVEVGDPSCPYCHIADGKNPELAKQVGSQFTYVSDGGSYVPPVSEMKKLVDSGKASYAYIYYPGHGNGEMATKALYCANDQGKFWEVHDVLYTNKAYDLLNNTIKNDKTKTKDLVAFIGNAADGKKLTECIDSGKYDKRLTDDQALGMSLGIQGTPGFFVNSTSYPGAYNYNDMKPTVDAALK